MFFISQFIADTSKWRWWRWPNNTAISMNIAINKAILYKKNKRKYTVYKKYTAELYLLINGGWIWAEV